MALLRSRVGLRCASRYCRRCISKRAASQGSLGQTVAGGADSSTLPAAGAAARRLRHHAKFLRPPAPVLAPSRCRCGVRRALAAAGRAGGATRRQRPPEDLCLSAPGEAAPLHPAMAQSPGEEGAPAASPPRPRPVRVDAGQARGAEVVDASPAGADAPDAPSTLPCLDFSHPPSCSRRVMPRMLLADATRDHAPSLHQPQRLTRAAASACQLHACAR